MAQTRDLPLLSLFAPKCFLLLRGDLPVTNNEDLTADHLQSNKTGEFQY